MTIKFTNDESIRIAPPVEQKMFNGAQSAGKIIIFSIEENSLTLDQASELLTTDNISSLELISDDGENTKTITGYERVAMLVARYQPDTSAIIEVQLSKGI